MNSPLRVSFRTQISGQTVLGVSFDEDGLGIDLTSGWNISVWSSFSLEIREQEIDRARVTEIIGTSLIASTRDGDNERFVFSQGYEVIVQLAMRIASQPEAMMVRGPDSLIVVWND